MFGLTEGCRNGGIMGCNQESVKIWLYNNRSEVVSAAKNYSGALAS